MGLSNPDECGENILGALFAASSLSPIVFVDTAVLLSKWHVSEQRGAKPHDLIPHAAKPHHVHLLLQLKLSAQSTT